MSKFRSVGYVPSQEELPRILPLNAEFAAVADDGPPQTMGTTSSPPTEIAATGGDDIWHNLETYLDDAEAYYQTQDDIDAFFQREQADQMPNGPDAFEYPDTGPTQVPSIDPYS